MSENDQLLAQTDISVFPFRRLFNKVRESIPNALKIINDGVREIYPRHGIFPGNTSQAVTLF